MFSFLISSGEHRYTWIVGRRSTANNTGINNFTKPRSGLMKYPATAGITNKMAIERPFKLCPNTEPRLETTSLPTATNQNSDGKTIRQRKARFLYDVCESSLDPPSLDLLGRFSPELPPSFFTIAVKGKLNAMMSLQNQKDNSDELQNLFLILKNMF